MLLLNNASQGNASEIKNKHYWLREPALLMSEMCPADMCSMAYMAFYVTPAPANRVSVGTNRNVGTLMFPNQSCAICVTATTFIAF